MRFLRQDFVWQFVGGFALGALALAVAHPSGARRAVAGHVEQVARRL